MALVVRSLCPALIFLGKLTAYRKDYEATDKPFCKLGGQDVRASVDGLA